MIAYVLRNTYTFKFSIENKTRTKTIILIFSIIILTISGVSAAVSTRNSRMAMTHAPH